MKLSTLEGDKRKKQGDILFNVVRIGRYIILCPMFYIYNFQFSKRLYYIIYTVWRTYI